MRVAVTGGAGFIGSHLCAALAAAPQIDGVAVLDDLSAGTPPPGDGVEFVEGSILDPAATRAVLAGADAVVHLAARSSVSDSMRDPVATYQVNAFGSALVLEAARACAVRLVVLASSAAVYGDVESVPVGEQQPARPVNPYGASKLAAETYALAHQAAFGLPVLVLRPFNVYGPGQRPGGQDGAVLPIFLDAALRHEPVPVNGDGLQTRDFVYVGDVCRLIVAAVVDGVSAPGPVNVGAGIGTTLLDLLAGMEQALGQAVRRTHREPRPGDIRHSVADVTLLHRLFPRFRPTPLAEGLAGTVAAHRREVASGGAASRIKSL
jgi:UDP-glucose 4-epimerase